MDEFITGFFIALGSLVALVWAATFFVIVNQKHAVVIEFLGKFYSVKHAGLGLKPPFPLAWVAGEVNLQIRELSSKVTVKSSDKAFLTVPVKVQYQASEDRVKEAFYELDEPQKQMESYIFNMVRSKASSFTMEELFASKDSFENDVKIELNERFEPFGYKIINALVDDPQPSEEVVFAYNRVLAAEREKDAARNEAEALKIKLVGEADAEKESLILKGEAFKAFRMKIAEGNVEAMRLMRDENSTLTEKDVLDFFAGVDQREAIRDAARGEGNTVVVPVSNAPDVDYAKISAMVAALKQ